MASADIFDEFKLDPEQREKIMSFVSSQRGPVALVSSGGTTVPLEQKTVRFIDNFSTGGR